MGVTVAVLLAATSIGLNIAAGAKAKKVADKEAELIEDQTVAEVKRQKRLADQFIDQQRGAVLAAGGLLEGSVIELFEETRTQSIEEIELLKRTSSRQAGIIREGGRQQFIGSVIGGLSSGFNILSGAGAFSGKAGGGRTSVPSRSGTGSGRGSFGSTRTTVRLPQAGGF